MGALQISGILSNGVAPLGGARPLFPFAQPVLWTRGEDGSITVVVKDPSGALSNLTDCALFFHLKRRGEADPFITRLAILTDPASGEATFYFVSEDTFNEAAGSFMSCDVWLHDDAGKHQIVLSSQFVLRESEASCDEDPSDPVLISPITNGVVDTVTALALVDASDLTDWFTMAVRDSGGGVGAYWHVEIGQSYSIDSNHIAAFNLPGGQWVRGLGASGEPVLSRGLTNGEWISSTVDGSEDVMPRPVYMDFGRFSLAVMQVICQLQAAVKVSGGTATIRVRLGGTKGAADGTIIATGTVTGSVYVAAEMTAAAFTKPSGQQLIQVTFQNAANLNTFIDGAAVECYAA